MNQRNRFTKLSAISRQPSVGNEERGTRSERLVRPRSSFLAPRPSARRGVLLLVVLSLLVLFMLIGTAFLMSSNQYRKGMKEQAKQDRIGNYPTKLLDRAVMQILRDTDNPQSAIRYHSLLRDLYGTDGFEGVSLFAAQHGFDLGRRSA